LPPARRTREINSPRRFHPLVRNAQPPAGSAARPPFVQLFASSTGRPIYCQSRYTASRALADICSAGKRARLVRGKDRRFCNCNRDARKPASHLTPAGRCINQRRVVTRARIIIRCRSPCSSLSLSLSLSFSRFHSRSLYARKINKCCGQSVNSGTSMRARDTASVAGKSAAFSLSHYEANTDELFKAREN
jgi:hypothetical protein